MFIVNGVSGSSLHCINFGVAMEPACGTAGFLISGAEYIRNEYGNKMTSEQWKNIARKLLQVLILRKTFVILLNQTLKRWIYGLTFEGGKIIGVFF